MRNGRGRGDKINFQRELVVPFGTHTKTIDWKPYIGNLELINIVWVPKGTTSSL
jgi:hypothetical protein